MNGVYQRILQNLINSNCSLPAQSNEFYEYLAHIAEALPDFLEKIDLDSNPPSYQEGDANPVPDWKESIFYHDGSERIGVRNIWNESLRNLWYTIDKYSKQSINGVTGKDERELDIYREPKGNDDDEPVNTVILDDIRYGDAGANFLNLLSQYQKQYGIWVKPEKNLIGQTYKSVRGVDYVLKQMLNETLLQFTNYFSIDYDDPAANRGIIHSQIRLLMPKNSRWVLVEDLNRNFWVLGNTIGGLCAYLFGAGSPIKDIFERLVNELVQLWENTIFLWILAAFALIKPCTDIHVEMFFVPNDINEPYKKYDNFDSFQSIPASKARIIANTVAYAKKYQNSNCVMFPMIRKNNYQKNYFDWIFIPYVIFIIHEGDGTEKVITQRLMYDNNSKWIQAHPAEYKKYLWCARESLTDYEYAYPISSIPDVRGQSKHKYYSGFRPHISFDKKSFESGNIVLENLNITFTDAIGESFNKDNLTTLSFNFKKLTSANGNDYINSTIIEEQKSSSSLISINNIKPTVDVDNTFAYYLGDFPSDWEESLQGKHFERVDSNSLKTSCCLIKIGQYLPKGYASNLGQNGYFAEQTDSSGGVTGYKLNYTPIKYIKGDEYYDNKGSGYIKKQAKCLFFIPKINKADFKLYNNDGILGTGAKEKLKQNGFDIISDYIKYHNVNSITYYMAAIGACPWHNGHQGYWSENILTHMFRFVPAKLVEVWKTKIDFSNAIRIDKQDTFLGYIECLGLVSSIEMAYGDIIWSGSQKNGTVYFYPKDEKVGNTTWRLPELRPAYGNDFEGYVELIDRYERNPDQKYFIDMAPLIEQDPNDELVVAYNNQDWDTFINILNDYNKYLTYEQYITDSYDISDKLTALSALWTVYDGTKKITIEASNNLEYYQDRTLDNNTKVYKQVGRTYFIFNDGQMILPTETRPVQIYDENKQQKTEYAYSRKREKYDKIKQSSHLVDGTVIFVPYNKLKNDDKISW